jgi:LSD1 subclass zinc finger protein
MIQSQLLECPECRNLLTQGKDQSKCSECHAIFPTVYNIPRFVPSGNYTESFGFQWNKFEQTQIDSKLQTNRSENRFLEETLWDSKVLKNKFVLDAGCGAGRFSEVALKYGANLLAVDFSNAVNTAEKNLKSGSKLVIQADLANLPIKSNSLDYIYCIGVLQHTRNPDVIVKELIRCLKVDGELALTFYENSSWHVKFYSKYLVRPITKRLPPQLLLNYLRATSKIWFPVTSSLFKLPEPLSRLFRFLIPIANYVEFEYNSKADAISESILDTFDMLSPAYDRPIKKSTILKWVQASGHRVTQLPHKPKWGTMRFKKIQ